MPAGPVNVPEVFLLTLVDVTEHPLKEHLGEAEYGVEWGAQLVGHAGQELGLVAAGDLQLEALFLELAVELCVEKGERRLTSERLQQVKRLPREVPRALAPDDE